MPEPRHNKLNLFLSHLDIAEIITECDYSTGTKAATDEAVNLAMRQESNVLVNMIDNGEIKITIHIDYAKIMDGVTQTTLIDNHESADLPRRTT